VTAESDPKGHRAIGRVAIEVVDADSARSLGSGDLPVLGTPRVVALVEAAAVAALAGTLDDGSTSVGIKIELQHLAPTRIGALVIAEAALTGIDGKIAEFAVRAESEDREIACGTHLRAIVDRERFLARPELSD